MGSHIVFIDESGFLLTPTVRRTWGPRGCTPIIRHHQKRDKVSVISGLSVSPKRKHIGLYFQCHKDSNIRGNEVADFLRLLLRQLQNNLIVIWDNGSSHKGNVIRELCANSKRILLEPLPSYAPELNPDEGVWNQAKTLLANGRPDDTDKLRDTINVTLSELKRSQSKLRWCFHQSDLPALLK